MDAPSGTLRKALTWADLLPSIRIGAWVVALFAAVMLLASEFETPIRETLSAHPRLGLLVFAATSVMAVLVPMLSNLPLVPLAVLAWGPAWTALLLLGGWMAGSAISFTLGRHARLLILRHFPSVNRHAGIDRLIHPRHRMRSLILLRMTFPVDVLSYSLGMFSRNTTLIETALSTAVGGAPFAVLFALYPSLPAMVQLFVFAACVLVFAAHVMWVLHAPSSAAEQEAGPGDR